MSSGLSGTLFQGNSQDAMLVKDAYTVSTATTNNSVYASMQGAYGDGIKGLYANKGSVSQLTSLIKQSQTGTVSKMDMMTRALSSMGSSLPSLLGTLGGSLKNKLADAAGSFIGPGAAKLVNITYGQLGNLVKVASVGNAQSLVTFVSELSGNSDLAKLVDIEAESAIIGGIAKELLAFGIPELVDEAIAMSKNAQVQANAYSYLSSSAISGSDLATINRVIDKIGLAAFLTANPNAVDMILNSFFFGTKDTVDTYVAKRAELIATLVRIDPHWSEYSRAGVYVTKLEPFTVSSKDAKTLFALAEPEKTSSILAINWLAKGVNSIIKDLYPDAYVT